MRDVADTRRAVRRPQARQCQQDHGRDRRGKRTIQRPSSHCSPMSSDRRHLCERRASARRIKLIEILKDFDSERMRGAGGRSSLPRARQILPGVYRRLTIPGHPCGTPGRPAASAGKAPPCASSDRMPPHGSQRPSARRARGAAAFRSPRARRRASTQPVAALRTIGGIDALIALQGQDDPAERRRRAVKRGRTALDALDELKIEALGGTLGPSTLMRLKSATADLRTPRATPGSTPCWPRSSFALAVEIAKMARPLTPKPLRFPRISGCHIFRACRVPGGRTISSPREQGGSCRVGWGQMKNKNGNKVVGGDKRSNGIKGVNGGTAPMASTASRQWSQRGNGRGGNGQEELPARPTKSRS